MSPKNLKLSRKVFYTMHSRGYFSSHWCSSCIKLLKSQLFTTIKTLNKTYSITNCFEDIFTLHCISQTLVEYVLSEEAVNTKEQLSVRRFVIESRRIGDRRVEVGSSVRVVSGKFSVEVVTVFWQVRFWQMEVDSSHPPGQGHFKFQVSMTSQLWLFVDYVKRSLTPNPLWFL